MCLEGRIYFELFRARWLDSRLDVNILSRSLGKKRERAAHSNQKNNEGESSRVLFAVQHRSH